MKQWKTLCRAGALGICLLAIGALTGCAGAYYGYGYPGSYAYGSGYYGPDYYGYYDPGYFGYYGDYWAPGVYGFGYWPHRDFDRGFRGRGFDHRGFAGRFHGGFQGRGGFARGGGHGGFARGGGGGHGGHGDGSHIR